MQIKKQSSSKKIVLIIVAILVIICGGAAAMAYYKVGPFASKSTDSVNLDRPTDDQVKAGSSAKAQTADSDSKSSSTGSDPLPSPTPASTPGGKSTVGMDITAANQNSSTLQVRTLIQTISSTGECILKMSGPSGKAYSASASVHAIASSTTCEGFDIPMSSLSAGSWKISISFENDSLAASASREVTLQ